MYKFTGIQYKSRFPEAILKFKGGVIISAISILVCLGLLLYSSFKEVVHMCLTVGIGLLLYFLLIRFLEEKYVKHMQ